MNRMNPLIRASYSPSLWRLGSSASTIYYEVDGSPVRYTRTVWALGPLSLAICRRVEP